MLFAASCSNDSESIDEPNNEDVPATSTTRKTITLSRAEQQIVDHMNEFAFKLFAEDAYDEENMKNYIFSPTSAYINLSMMANGAQATTLDEYLKMLNVVQSGVDGLNVFNNRLSSELSTLDDAATLRLANSIWETPKLSFSERFIQSITSQYGGVKYFNDFSVSHEPFNNWLKAHTDGMITTYLDSQDEPEYLVANVCCFKGKWATPFDASKTKKQSFTNANGVEKSCVMMKGEVSGKYAETSDGIKAYRLSYGAGAYRYTIIMPENNNTDINTVVSQLTPSKWNEINGRMQGAKIDVTMPKLKFDNQIALTASLSKLGMKTAFSNDADYSAMSSQNIMADLTQRIFFEIDEEGTKGAVVSSQNIIWATDNKAVNLSADSPFIFIVDETSTGAILFAGVVRDIPQ